MIHMMHIKCETQGNDLPFVPHLQILLVFLNTPYYSKLLRCISEAGVSDLINAVNFFHHPTVKS